MENIQSTDLLKLTSTQRQNPELVLKELFDYANLPEQKEMLWQWFTAAITSGNAKRKMERESLVFCYEQMEKLLEAAFLLNEQSKNKPQPANK